VEGRRNNGTTISFTGSNNQTVLEVTMPKVFVVNRGCHDYSMAEKIGPLIFMSEGSMNRFDASAIWRKFNPFIESSSKDDLILISGLTVMSVVACCTFMHKHGKLNILLYKSTSKGGEYIRETITFGGESGKSIGDTVSDSPVTRLRRVFSKEE
jgi:hypothetical protein